MSLAPWRSPLARALHCNRSLIYARYLQLATVRADGRPANRTVVFRGFLDSTNQLQIVTDSRSDKADQIQKSPWGEICWYFPNTREQFRMMGQMTLAGEACSDPILQEARQTAWQQLSNAARTQFLWPDPGQPKTNPASLDSPQPDNHHPLPTFCLLLLNPDRVDHLELKGSPQNRWLYLKDRDQWSCQEINP